MSYRLKVHRTRVDDIATYSTCELWYGPVCVFRQNGIENTKLRMAAGVYEARFTKSPRFTAQATAKARKADPNCPEVPVYTWEILGVMDGTRARAGLRIHPVNFAKDLLGCLAFGMDLADLNKDGELDLTRSTEAVRIFNQQAARADKITVEIIDPA